MYDYHLKQSIHILLPLLFKNLKENHIEEASGGQTLQYQPLRLKLSQRSRDGCKFVYKQLISQIYPPALDTTQVQQ